LTRTVIGKTITVVLGLRRKFRLNNEFSHGRSTMGRLPQRRVNPISYERAVRQPQ
jgi:hypothetical protein